MKTIELIFSRVSCLKQYRAIAEDVGDQESLRFDATELHTILDRNGIPKSFEIHSSTYISAVADLFQNHVMPLFRTNLCSPKIAIDQGPSSRKHKSRAMIHRFTHLQSQLR